MNDEFIIRLEKIDGKNEFKATTSIECWKEISESINTLFECYGYKDEFHVLFRLETLIYSLLKRFEAK